MMFLWLSSYCKPQSSLLGYFRNLIQSFYALYYTVRPCIKHKNIPKSGFGPFKPYIEDGNTFLSLLSPCSLA